jgi:hypothetical protein
MLSGLRRGLRDDRQLQAPPDYFSNITHRHVFGNRVITASRTLLQCEPVETGGIGQVRRRPSILAVPTNAETPFPRARVTIYVISPCLFRS